MNPNVPKFTSFRPKPKPPAELAQTPPPQPENVKHKHLKHHRDTVRTERSGKRRKLSEERETEQQHKEKSHLKFQPSFLAAQGVTSDLFFSDRRGDRDIERYGTLNRYEVPRYRSFGYGYVLGLPLDRKIDRNLSTDKEVVIAQSTSSGQKRVLTDRHALKNYAKAIKFVKAAAEKDSLEADFIALSRSNKSTRNNHDHDNHDDDRQGEDEIADYRQLDRVPSDNGPSDPDTEYESDTVSGANPEVTQRNAALVRQTREHPQDLTGWFNLIEHQEVMMMSDHIHPEMTSSDRRHLAEVRISIYEQALRKLCNERENQAKLYGGLMSEASFLWDARRRDEKWTEILKNFPLDTELWLQYLNDVQSDWSTFTYEKCRDAFSNCLKTLQSGGPEFILYILVRLTSMTYQAGNQALAIGIWQALLEFHLLKPLSREDHSLTEDILSFEEFWDSDVARVGEEGATGWRDFDLDSTPKYPGRLMDDIDDDNLLNVVLFADIEDILKCVPRDIDAVSLVNAFLGFCHMPPLVQEENVQKYQLDPFLQETFTETSANMDRSDAFADVLKRYSSCPLKKYQATTELLFTYAFPEKPHVVDVSFLRRVFKLLAADTNAGESIGVYLLALESTYFPSEAFKSAKRLLKARPNSLILYNAYGLVESKRGNSSKADQVFSAALSMQQQTADQRPLSTPGSLELFSNWIWEALRKGDHPSALWRLTSPSGQLPNYEEETPPQSTVLRARTLLSNITARALLKEDYIRAVISTSLSALLAYLSKPSPIAAALSIHSSLTRHFTTHANPTAHELQGQSITTLLTHHAIYAYSPSTQTQTQTQRTIVKPSLIRHTLEPFLEQFPSNTIILSLYAANEARFALDDRVRDHFTASHSNDDIVGSAFAIHHERLRAHAIAAATTAATISTSSFERTPQLQVQPQPQPHATRALFTTVSKAIPHCPALHKARAEFELTHFLSHDAAISAKSKSKPTKHRGRSKMENTVSTVQKQARKRLRQVYIEGLTKLPWCKAYMLLGLEIADVLKRSGEDEVETGDDGGDLRVLVEKVMGEKLLVA